MKGNVSIEGIQELQAYNVRAIASLRPDGVAGEAVQYGTAEVHRYAVAITHVITGSLRGTHRMAIEGGGERGRISLDPGTINPRTRQKPSVYGVGEHERGGSHAFYDRTVDERGKYILGKMGDIIHGGLKRA